MNKEINTYEAPLVYVVEISLADLICASGQSEWYEDGDTADWFNN